MPHGGPDWGTLGPISTIYTIEDMAELAVRLGSIVTFDRRGNVVWLDDFEGGINCWRAGYQGTGAGVASSAESVRNGAFSAKLTPGNAEDDYAWAGHYCPYPVVSKVGFEISFALDDDTPLLDPELKATSFTHTLRDGSYYHYAELQYLSADRKLQYRDENLAWQDLATNLLLHTYKTLFHTVKLVIDLSTQKYVRAILDNVEYDMSTLSYYYTSGTSAAYWWQGVRAIARKTTNPSVYVDDAILTQNEP